MDTLLIVLLVVLLLGGGGWDTLVGGSARGPLTCPRSRPLGTKNRSERAHSEALEDLVEFESLRFIASS